MKKLWKKWDPISNLHSHYNFIELIEDGGLIVILSNNTHQIKIDFDGFFIFGYRQLNRNCAVSPPEKNWSLYTTENNEFINSILKDSPSIHLYDTRMQFSIFTNQCVIDVVIANRDSVTVEIIKKKRAMISSIKNT